MANYYLEEHKGCPQKKFLTRKGEEITCLLAGTCIKKIEPIYQEERGDRTASTSKEEGGALESRAVQLMALAMRE